MKRMLFVDDEPSVLEAQRRVWRAYRAQWQVETIEGGAAAIRLLESSQFDVVVSDARMPAVGGEAVLRACRTLQPEAIRIVLSGQIDRQSGSGLSAVAHQFLVKPTSAQVILAAVDEACAVRDSLTNPNVRQMVMGLGELAIAPSTYGRLVAVLESPAPSMEAICEVVQDCPSVCATVLRLVSSAFFGMPRKVSSVREAVVLLGLEVLRELVLAAEVLRGPDPLGIVDETMRRALMRARTSRVLSSGLTPTTALTSEAALMADLGVLLFSQRFGEAYAPLWRSARSGAALAELEREAFGATHAQISASVLALWNLPAAVVAAVAQHHHPVTALTADSTAIAAIATLIDEASTAQGAASLELRQRIDEAATLKGLSEKVSKALLHAN
jgi:HD-like signal output (HDOD) protein